jgi:hypothetical protein
MLARSILAAALALGLSSLVPAQAQVAQVVTTCGVGVALPPGPGGRLFMDATGVLCTSGSSAGGGAGTASAASSSAGGVSNFSRIPSSAASSNLTNAKPTAGRAYTYQGCNTTASTIYLRIYNAASTTAVTVGTTAPFAGPYAFPATTCVQATTFAADLGIYASAGLTYAFGTTPADTDATAITAGGIAGFQLGYQ